VDLDAGDCCGCCGWEVGGETR